MTQTMLKTINSNTEPSETDTIKEDPFSKLNFVTENDHDDESTDCTADDLKEKSTNCTTDYFQRNKVKEPKIIRPNLKLDIYRSKFTKELQSWEGVVTEIQDNEFTAILSDKTNSDLPKEIVTLDFEEVDFRDHPLIVPGSVFYWSIGYLDAPGQPRERKSVITFRRLIWAEDKIEEAKKTGKELAKFFAQD